jgi:hypothetical protein
MSSNPSDSLQEALDLFRAHERGIIRGPFLRATGTRISSWLAANQLKLIRSRDGLLAAAVIAVARFRQPVKDFSRATRFHIEPGDLIVKRLACRSGYEQVCSSFLISLTATTPRVWLRLWQEHPVDRGVAHLAYAKSRATKILSGSELVGIWLIGKDVRLAKLPPSERWTIRRLQIDPLSVDDAKLGVLAKGDQLVTHYSTQYNDRGSWSALCVRGYGGRSDFIIKPSEMPKEWRKHNQQSLVLKIEDTDAREKLPELEPLIRAVPGVKHRVRLMRLAAGGSIKRHTDSVDPDAGTTNGKNLRIHIPLYTNSTVWFTGWDLNGHEVKARMREGEAWYLDTRKPHQVENRGNTDRLHLVMDVVSCPKLLELLR